MTTTRTHSVQVVCCAVATAALLAGCGSGQAAHRPVVKADHRSTPYAAAEGKGGAITAASTIGVARSVADLLPNRKHEVLEHNFVANSDSVVEATPLDVQPGEAFVWPRGANDSMEANEVTFEDPRSMSRTWTVRLHIESPVAGADPSAVLPAATEGTEVVVQLPSNGGPVDIDRYRAGVLGLGRSVWFLTTNDFGPKDKFEVAWFGGAVARADQDGTLRFELLPEDVRKVKEAPGTTLADLAVEAAKPEQRITLGQG